MADDETFDATWKLLSKVLTDGRAARHQLGNDHMSAVFDAYKASRGTNPLEADLTVTQENIEKLSTPDIKAILGSETVKTVNGVKREVLEKRYSEVQAVSNDVLASEAVREKLRQRPEQEARLESALNAMPSPEAQRQAEMNEEAAKKQRVKPQL